MLDPPPHDVIPASIDKEVASPSSTNRRGIIAVLVEWGTFGFLQWVESMSVLPDTKILTLGVAGSCSLCPNYLRVMKVIIIKEIDQAMRDHLDLSFITFKLAFTSFVINAVDISLSA